MCVPALHSIQEGDGGVKGGVGVCGWVWGCGCGGVCVGGGVCVCVFIYLLITFLKQFLPQLFLCNVRIWSFFKRLCNISEKTLKTYSAMILHRVVVYSYQPFVS